MSRHKSRFPIGWIAQGGTRHWMTRAERAAYDAPFPSADHKVAARVYPLLVPVSNYSLQASADNQRAWQVFERWTKPFVCCFSDGDPITEGLDREFLDRVPGTGGQPHTPLRGGHFVQEDSGPGFARVVIQACRLDAFRHEPPIAASARVAALAA